MRIGADVLSRYVKYSMTHETFDAPKDAVSNVLQSSFVSYNSIHPSSNPSMVLNNVKSYLFYLSVINNMLKKITAVYVQIKLLTGKCCCIGYISVGLLTSVMWNLVSVQITKILIAVNTNTSKLLMLRMLL